MGRGGRYARVIRRLRPAVLAVVTCIPGFSVLFAQSVIPQVGERIVVRGGVAEVSARNLGRVNLAEMTPDSLYKFMAAIDSLRADGVRFDRAGTDEVITSLIDRSSPTGDSLDADRAAELLALRKGQPLNSATVRHFMDDRAFIERYIDGGADTLIPRFAPSDTLSARQKRRLARRSPDAYRHSAVFRDSMRLSPMVAVSIVVPGFSQLYNRQYWKIPVLYGALGAGIGMWAWQTKQYRPYRELYDYFDLRRVKPGEAGYAQYKNTMIDLQGNMIRHNTYRQLAFGFAIASYMYSLVDGTLNYPGTATDVKKATTLATVFPGAGQVYNGSYWKLPIVLGGGATLLYVVNWNNRGYQRYLRAYIARTDRNDETIDEFAGTSLSPGDLESRKNSFRRQRDLSLILTGLFYVLQIVDAHATAHMKAYDVSDDLARRVTFGPSMDGFYSQRLGGQVNSFGFSLNLRF